MSSILVCSLKFFAVQRAAQNSLEYRDSTARSMGQLILVRAVMILASSSDLSEQFYQCRELNGAKRLVRSARSELLGVVPFCAGGEAYSTVNPKNFLNFLKLTKKNKLKLKHT